MATSASFPEQAHQPRLYPFPKRSFGNKVAAQHSFQPSWFDKWPWLHYLESSDAVFCITCAQARSHNKLNWSLNMDLAFLSTGFSNWKDATRKFAQHESVLKTLALPSSTPNIAEALSSQTQKERLDHRKCFLKIVANVRFLARQGLPLRGHGDQECDSNFMQLLKLISEDDHNFDSWIKKKTDKYTSPEMQNEILKVMAHHILRQVVESLKTASFLTRNKWWFAFAGWIIVT